MPKVKKKAVAKVVAKVAAKPAPKAGDVCAFCGGELIADPSGIICCGKCHRFPGEAEREAPVAAVVHPPVGPRRMHRP